MCMWCSYFSVFLNQVHATEGCTGLVSWNCFGSHVGMCVYLCVSVCPPPALITSGMIWCDIDHVWLVKQILRLFPAFNYFIWHLPSIKWIGVTILIQHIVNACQRKLRWFGTNYKRTTRKRSTSLIKVSRQMHSDAFKRRHVFSFTVIILASNNFLLLLKRLITKALEYKAILKL